jgi:23S rRNA (adenine2503-C2)-methyltransferase
MPDLRSLTPAQLEALCAELGWPRYTAGQVFTWLWQKGVDDIAAMTNLSKERRALLAERFSVRLPELFRTIDDEDGTTKFTFKLEDGNVIESVFIPESPRSALTPGPRPLTPDPRPLTPDPGRRTVCVSTQVGCRLGCGFCYTGQLGFKRNLAWHEIASQVLSVRQYLGNPKPQIPNPKPADLENPKSKTQNPKPGPPLSSLLPPPLTNVVFMGMGEPFLNYEATIEAAKTINAENGLGIGARRITISTSGIPEGIRAFTQVPQQFRLALSLNASDDETRSKLMPVNKLYPLKEVMAAIRAYTDAKGKRVTFEYVLVDGVNNRDKDVKQLGVLLKGIPCKLNLIPLNPFPGCELEAPTPESVEAFARKLWPLVPAVTVRRSKGASILAGCGQLAGTADS